MSLSVQAISLIRQNVTSTLRSTDFFALAMPGVRSISLNLMSRAKNDEAPILDETSAGGGSVVILDDVGQWEDD